MVWMKARWRNQEQVIIQRIVIVLCKEVKGVARRRKEERIRNKSLQEKKTSMLI